MQQQILTARQHIALYAACGLLLAGATFSPWWQLQLMCLYVMVPVFVSLRHVPADKAYILGLVFALGWIIPTTYWYYNFMPLWLAFCASVGFATLLANVFHTVLLRKRLGYGGVVVAYIAVWVGLTAARLHLPIARDWWLPHIGYSVWHNPGILWVGKFGGEVMIEVVVLALNAALAYCLVKHGYKAFAYASLGLLCAVVAGNVAVWNMPAKPISPAIALQAMTSGGVDQPATDQDVSSLLRMVTDAHMRYASSDTVTVVLPENAVPATSEKKLSDFAVLSRLWLVYHTTERVGADTYKKVHIVDPTGSVRLTNYKYHIAPDEHGKARFSAEILQRDAQTISGYTCYDLHYPDIVQRLTGVDIAYVPINDAAYGYLQRQFHAADIALRAVQANTSIVTASTNGPTMVVSSNGVVLQSLVTTESAVMFHDSK